MRKYNKAVIVAILAACMISGCSSQSQSKIQTSKENKAATTSMPSVSMVPVESLKVDEVPRFSKEQVRGMKVTRFGYERYDLNYRPKEGKDSYLYWELTEPYKSTATVDTEIIYRLFDSIAAIDFSKSSKVEKGIDTGIEKSKTSIRLLYAKDRNELSAQNKLTLIIGKTDHEGNYYCALEGVKDHVFLIDHITVDAVLNQDPFNMILKVPYLINVATVGEVMIQYGSQSHLMKMEQDTYQLDKRTVDRKEYCTLYSKLMGVEIEKEVPKDAGTKKNTVPVITMKFKRNIQNAEDYDVVIYAYDDSSCSVQVNGDEFFLVSKKDVDTLIETLKSAFK